MNNQLPLVSSIITTYKREPSVVESAINSVEEQTYPNIEIIVVDDNISYSRESELINQMCKKHPKVRYIKQNGNKGACAARNLGILNSKGEFIGCLDDDDLWLPSKIECQIEHFTDESIGLVFSNGIRREIESGDERPYNAMLEEGDTFVTFNDMLHVDRIGSTSNPLIRKQCFKNVGLFWEEQPARQDYEMWLRITQKYKAYGLGERLFVHTIHTGDQISRNKKKAYIGFRNVYKRYHNEFKKDPKAENFITENMLINRYKFSFELLYVGFRYVLTKGRIMQKD